MKRYVIFAGVNGAGKSTLYRAFPKFKDMPRINTEEFRRIAIYKSGRLVRLSHDVPDWFGKIEL